MKALKQLAMFGATDDELLDDVAALLRTNNLARGPKGYYPARRAQLRRLAEAAKIPPAFSAESFRKKGGR